MGQAHELSSRKCVRIMLGEAIKNFARGGFAVMFANGHVQLVQQIDQYLVLLVDFLNIDAEIIRPLKRSLVPMIKFSLIVFVVVQQKLKALAVFNFDMDQKLFLLQGAGVWSGERSEVSVDKILRRLHEKMTLI